MDTENPQKKHVFMRENVRLSIRMLFNYKNGRPSSLYFFCINGSNNILVFGSDLQNITTAFLFQRIATLVSLGCGSVLSTLLLLDLHTFVGEILENLLYSLKNLISSFLDLFPHWIQDINEFYY